MSVPFRHMSRALPPLRSRLMPGISSLYLYPHPHRRQSTKLNTNLNISRFSPFASPKERNFTTAKNQPQSKDKKKYWIGCLTSLGMCASIYLYSQKDNIELFREMKIHVGLEDIPKNVVNAIIRNDLETVQSLLDDLKFYGERANIDTLPHEILIELIFVACENSNLKLFRYLFEYDKNLSIGIKTIEKIAINAILINKKYRSSILRHLLEIINERKEMNDLDWNILLKAIASIPDTDIYDKNSMLTNILSSLPEHLNEINSFESMKFFTINPNTLPILIEKFKLGSSATTILFNFIANNKDPDEIIKITRLLRKNRQFPSEETELIEFVMFTLRDPSDTILVIKEIGREFIPKINVFNLLVIPEIHMDVWKFLIDNGLNINVSSIKNSKKFSTIVDHGVELENAMTTNKYSTAHLSYFNDLKALLNKYQN